MYSDLDTRSSGSTQMNTTLPSSQVNLAVLPTQAVIQAACIKTSAFDQLQHLECSVAQATAMELSLIRQLHPEWHAMYEETPLDTADSAEMTALLDCAPNSFAKGLISGALFVRLQMAAITGRPF
jgi:hypothetical protein